MQRYKECLSYVLSLEGGFVDDPLDRGGATNKGITQKTYDNYRQKKNLSPQSVQFIEEREVEDIYKQEYWDRCRCSDISSPLDMVVFDSAVQHGVSRASKWLQHCVGTTADGIIGDKTIYALHGKVLNRRLQEVIDNYVNGRIAFYAQILANDPATITLDELKEAFILSVQAMGAVWTNPYE